MRWGLIILVFLLWSAPVYADEDPFLPKPTWIEKHAVKGGVEFRHGRFTVRGPRIPKKKTIDGKTVTRKMFGIRFEIRF